LCQDPEGHQLFRCQAFKDKTLSERKDYVNKNEICKICLRRNHLVETCYNREKLKCLACGQFGHNTLLHE
jgi:hypothetical protein